MVPDQRGRTEKHSISDQTKKSIVDTPVSQNVSAPNPLPPATILNIYFNSLAF